MSEHGNGKLAVSMGLGVVGAVRTNNSHETLADTTPIARISEETDIVVVSKSSPTRPSTTCSPHGRRIRPNSPSAAARPPADPTTWHPC